MSQKTAVMRRICSWCRADLGTIRCRPEQAGEITHGICQPCLKKFKAEVEAIRVSSK